MLEGSAAAAVGEGNNKQLHAAWTLSLYGTQGLFEGEAKECERESGVPAFQPALPVSRCTAVGTRSLLEAEHQCFSVGNSIVTDSQA